ncbi:integrator complex subunit 6 [Centruroides vittatus]|uniref:integrator complex subunit 6 n=1 Tax=Centruroides vittatus TaxID=120091 RepID=UPI00350FD888
MTIILFLVDTSASMNQRTYLGARPTLLDVAKDAVEKFIKIRQRDSASRGDRYMLLTFEEPPSNIKAGWKESHATFMSELKNLQCYGMTMLGAALKHAFDLLNINRMQTGIDTYGQGRCPFYLEPSIIVVITDGGKLTTIHGVQDELNLPMHSSVQGSELTKEPFRWDQRLFSLVLRLTGTPPVERDPNSVVPPDTSPIDAMCEVTGGRSYAITSQRMLMQCLESLVQKIQGGVVIFFEKIGPDPPPINNEENNQDEKNKLSQQNHCIPNNNQNGTITPSGMPNNSVSHTAWQSCRKLIYVQRSAQKGYSVGYWPIPESFWPDMNSPALPPRNAHPVVKFTCTNNEPMVIDNLPFDKYELEPSPLTQYILSRKQPTVAWQVFISNSHKSTEIGHTFGYLKASTSLTCVNLFVLPYNYPILLPLLDELFKVHRCKPTREWKIQFDNYLKNMPLYYAGPLKRALQRMGAPNLVPDSMENCLSYSVLNYLKRLKNQAKAEFEKLISSVGTGKPLTPEGIRVNPIGRSMGPAVKLSEISLTSNPAIVERFSNYKSELNDFTGFMLGIKDKEIKTESYRNPFDISRRTLLDQIARMRANYLQSSVNHTRIQDDDQLHSLPVSQMGNYQEYLKRMPTPLREIESTPVRQHMFGNPFKIEKRMMVDEADIDPVGGGGSPTRGQKRPVDSPTGFPRSKRKPGPLPREFRLWRPHSPSPTSNMNLQNSLSPQPTSNGPEDIELLFESKGRMNIQSNQTNEGNDSPWDIHNSSNRILLNHVNSRPTSNHVDGWNINNDVTSLDSDDLEQNENFFRDWSMRAEIVRIRAEIFKEIRRPGRNFEKLFQRLQTFQGNMATRIFMVREVIQEAGRFKRKTLIKLLEDYEQKLLQGENEEVLHVPASNVPR